MTVIALVEVAIPLQRRNRWSTAHRAPNLTLTAITFATSMVFNALLVGALFALQAEGRGLLPWLALPFAVTTVLTVVVLDLSFDVAHVAMHHHPLLWRFHRVHHADPAVDVTTTIRQHPGEGVIRYVFMSAFAVAIGAPPAAFAIYRAWRADRVRARRLRRPRDADDRRVARRAVSRRPRFAQRAHEVS